MSCVPPVVWHVASIAAVVARHNQILHLQCKRISSRIYMHMHGAVGSYCVMYFARTTMQWFSLGAYIFLFLMKKHLVSPVLDLVFLCNNASASS